MKPSQAIRKPHGRAELGLLVALLLMAGGVWLVVRSVVANYSPPVLNEPQKTVVTRRAPESLLKEDTPQPASAGNGKTTKSMSAVTIIPDAKARETLLTMRDKNNTAPSDGTARAEAPRVAAAKSEGTDFDTQPLGQNTPEVQAALVLFDQYKQAGSLKEKLAFVFQPLQTEALMTSYYGAQGGRDPKLAGLIGASSVIIDGREALALASMCAEPRTIRFVSFHRTAEGLRIDWESLVGYGEKTWAQFRAGKSAEKVLMRALAQVDDYYNFEFADDKRYLSLRLHSPDREDYVHGFVLRAGEDGRRIIRLLGSAASSMADMSSGDTDSRMIPVTVELAFPPKSESDRCVKVERFVAPWWLALSDAPQAAAVSDLTAQP